MSAPAQSSACRRSRGPPRAVIVVAKRGAGPGAGFDRDLEPQLEESLDGLGSCGDPAFTHPPFPRHGNFHTVVIMAWRPSARCSPPKICGPSNGLTSNGESSPPDNHKRWPQRSHNDESIIRVHVCAAVVLLLLSGSKTLASADWLFTPFIGATLAPNAEFSVGDFTETLASASRLEPTPPGWAPASSGSESTSGRRRTSLRSKPVRKTSTSAMAT